MGEGEFSLDLGALAEEIHFAQEPLGKTLQGQIADPAAHAFIDPAEVIHVEAQHGQGRLPTPIHVPFQPLGDVDPVLEAGQRIVVVEKPDALLGLAPLRHVLKRAHERNHSPMLREGDFCLLSHEAGSSVGSHQPEVETAGFAGDNHAPFPLLEGLSIVRVDEAQETGPGQRGLVIARSQNFAHLGGAMDLVGVNILLPVAELGYPLGRFQAGLGLLDRRQSVRGPEHVPKPVAQEDPADRLGGELSGADLVRSIDRLDVVKSGQHDDGDVGG